MTFEELKDMVNSTINENGQRSITGKALNLAFIETLTAIEEFLENNKPKGGAVSEIVYFPNMTTGELDPADQAHNLEVYNKFKAAFDAGEPLPLLSVDIAFMFAEIESQLGQSINAAGYGSCQTVVFVPSDSPLAEQAGTGVTFTFMADGIDGGALLQADGNVILMN